MPKWGVKEENFCWKALKRLPHKDRKIRIFLHGMHTIDKAIGCSELGKGREGGRLKGKSTFFVLKLQTIIKCNKLEKAVITYIICVEVQDVHRTEV